MENNYTRYFEELKKTDPTSPFYTEIRKMELRIYALEESKHNSEQVTNLIKQSKTKLKELKRQQNLRETSDNFRELKKSEEEKLKEYTEEQLTRTSLDVRAQPIKQTPQERVQMIRERLGIDSKSLYEILEENKKAQADREKSIAKIKTTSFENFFHRLFKKFR